MMNKRDYLPCDGFKVIGGRPGVAGRYEEVPWTIDVPRALVSQVRECLERLGVAPVEVRLGYEFVKNEKGDHFPVDRIVLPADIEVNAIRAALRSLWESLA